MMRFFPLEFQRRIVAERLGGQVQELPGGHLVALPANGGDKDGVGSDLIRWVGDNPSQRVLDAVDDQDDVPSLLLSFHISGRLDHVLQ